MTIGWLFVLSCTVLLAQLPFLQQWLIWDRVEIYQGEWWRILTGNITHTNSVHMAMNLTALIVLTMIHKQYYHGRDFWLSVWVMMCLIGVMMLFTQFGTYAGLSGVLHGLFVWGVVMDMKNKIPFSKLLLMGVIFKLCYETFMEGDGLTQSMIEASIAYQAHWVGAIVGLIFALYRLTVLEKKPANGYQ